MTIKVKELFTRFGNQLKEHVILREHTPLAVGGVTDYFIEITNLDDLIDAITIAQKIKLPFHLIGSGNMILISDFGYPGLIIANRTSNISFLYDKSQVICDSGVIGSQLLMTTASHELGGMEELSIIPGTVGGIVASECCFLPKDKVSQFCLINIIKKMTVINVHGEMLTYPPTKYKNKDLILSLIIQLHHKRKEDIIRRIQDLKITPSEINISWQIFRDPPGQVASEIILSSGAWKIRQGEIYLSRNHPNQLINRGNGSASEARILIDNIRNFVQEKTGIVLEVAITYLGQW